MFSVIVILENHIAQSLMKKSILSIYFLATCILMTGCTYAQIETKANEAGNIVGRLIRGASNGLVEGFSGEKRKDSK